LLEYIERTEKVRTDSAVFLALRSPFKAISASAIAKVLDEAIGLAGLSGQGFSAKSFRPTSATVAIDQGVDPHIVQAVGRWKSTDVFYKHYVHSRTPEDFVNKVLHE
jgi:integrase